MRDKRARQSRTWFYPLFVLALGGTAILTSGCGGSGGGTGGRSAFQVSAQFAPYSGKDIQSYVGSIKVMAQTGSDTPLGPYVLKRGDSPLKIEGLAAGKTYRFTVEGLQGTNGTGSKVSYAQFDRVAPGNGQTTDVPITTMASEIASVTVSPSDVELAASESQVYAFEARNSSGAVILTDAQDSSFSVSINPNVGTFDPQTNTYTAPNVIANDQPDSRLDVSIGGVTGSGTIKFDKGGDLNIALKWNADGRGLPGYAGSARLSLVNGGIIVPGSTREVTRNQSGAHSQSVVWNTLPYGNYNLVVEGFGSTDFSGPVLASAEFPVTVEKNGGVTNIDMSTSGFKATMLKIYVQHGANAPTEATNKVVVNEGETVTVSAKATDAQGTVYLMGNQITMSTTGSNVSLTGNQLRGITRGTGSSFTANTGDTPPGSVTLPIEVAFGNPGVGVDWDAPTRDGAPGYAKSAQAEIFDSMGNPIPGFDPICFNRPASGRSNIYWPERLEPNTDFTIMVTLYPEWDCMGNALMDASAAGQTDANGVASQSQFDFPTVGNASNVEMWLTRADGSVERYSDIFPTPVGRRAGPVFLSFGEQVTINTRVTDAAGTVTFFSNVETTFNGNVDFDATNGRATAVNLGVGDVVATAQAGRGPEAVFETRVMPPAVIAFSDWDDEAFGLGAIKSYLYVPGARVNSPRGDKIWEVPYRDDAYLGRFLAEPGLVLPTGQCNGYDAYSPTVNSRGDKIAFVVAPYDTVSGDVTLYKDIVVMEISYDANGAPVFGSILPQNVPYDSADQICPMFGPQVDGAADNGRLYFSSIEFNRDTGAYLANTERDIFVRSDIFAASGPGVNLTSGIAGNLFWPTISPDNFDMAVVRKIINQGGVGDITIDAQPVGVGKIVTINLAPFAPSGEQIDVTASAASRIGFLPSKGVAPFGGGPLVDDDRYYIAFARSFDGGWTTQVELLRDERTQAALGAFITQQQNANNPFAAAVDGAAAGQFKVTNPRRVMCYLYNNTQLMVKNVTSPSSGGIGTSIVTLDPDLASTNIPSQPVWPAPFDVFAPLPR